MTANRGLALFRFAFAALTLAALITQLTYNLVVLPEYRVLNFFSFFTVESNILATVSFTVGGWLAWRGESPRWVELLRGAVVMYMTITGIIYSLLLSNIAVDTAVPWTNVVFHYLMPTVVVIDWLVDLPKRRITVRESALWLLFPIAYLVYSLIRGPIADWYPYPFLDPRSAGFGPVVEGSLIVAVLAFTLAAVIALSTKLQNTVPQPAVYDGDERSRTPTA